MPISLFVGVPIVAVCYLLVNVSFFIVLNYDQILSADAVALVSYMCVTQSGQLDPLNPAPLLYLLC